MRSDPILSVALMVFVIGIWSVGSAAEDVSVNTPAFKIGDEWRYTAGFIRVIGFEGEDVITAESGSRCQDCKYFRDKNWTLVKVLDAQGKPADVSTGLKVLDFPLYVGKEWNQETELRSVTTGLPRIYRNEFKVMAYEEVTVKAGKFKAFRIAWVQETRNVANPFVGHADLWWSPEVKNFVKRHVYTTRWLTDSELESYTLK